MSFKDRLMWEAGDIKKVKPKKKTPPTQPKPKLKPKRKPVP